MMTITESRREAFISRTTKARPYRMELMRQVRAGEITLAEAKRLAVKGEHQ